MPALDWIGNDAFVRHHQDVPFRLIESVADLICTAAKGMGARATRAGVTFWKTPYDLDLWMKNPLESARNADSRGSWDALLRAASAARKTAILTHTDLMVSEDGRIRRSKPADLQEVAWAGQGSNPVTAHDACGNSRPSRGPSHDRSVDMNLPDAIDAHVRALPAHLRREALDFIACLEKRYHIAAMVAPRLTTSAFIERFAGCLGDDFPDEIDDADLPGDAPRDPLDSNAGIGWLKGHPAIAAGVARAGIDAQYLCSPVWAELWFGACRSQRIAENRPRIRRASGTWFSTYRACRSMITRPNTAAIFVRCWRARGGQSAPMTCKLPRLPGREACLS